MTQRGRGRPPKFTTDELRDRLLEAAHQSLRERGPGCGLDAVTLDDAITDAAVPRGSAYQLWQDDLLTPQMAFRRALAVDILRRSNDRARVAVESIKTTFDLHNEDLEGDGAQRRSAFSQMARTIANDTFSRQTNSQGWRVYNALRAAMLGKTPPIDFALDAIRRGERQLAESLADVAATVARTSGLRLRDPYEIEDFVEAVLMITEGSSTRLTSSERTEHIQRPTGANGEMQEWTLLAVGVEALVSAFFELDDKT